MVAVPEQEDEECRDEEEGLRRAAVTISLLNEAERDSQNNGGTMRKQ